MKILWLLLITTVAASATVYTSTQSGLWSASATWGGAGVPTDGDTVNIGAHTVIVAANTTVGTSPNSTSSNVVALTSASSVLIVSNSATLTVKGNIGHVNGSTHRQLENTTLTFDNSGSGGSPAYQFNNVGFSNFRLGSNSTMQAISGQTFANSVAMSLFAATNANFVRASGLTWGSISGNVYLYGCVFNRCDRLRPTSTSATIDFIVDGNTFTNGTHATEDMNLTMSTAASSGTRRIRGNTFWKTVTYQAKSFDIQTNAFGNGIAVVAGSTWSHFRNNFVRLDGTLNGGNGALFPASLTRNYFVLSNAVGNPHFIAPSALLGSDTVVAQNIFEAHTPDLLDIGDAVLINASSTSGTNKVVGRNNIVLPISYTNNAASGTMLTIYNSASTSEWYRCTANVNDSWVGGTATNGMFAVAEASTGVAAQVGAIKSCLAWGSSANQGYFAVRQTGNVKDIITAANCDYNWRYGSKDGDNQRGYEDKAAANALWTDGDAAAASVDTHQGSGNPQFYDSARNLAKWSYDRGYTANNHTNAFAALMVQPTRVPDLINYVFEGFRVGNTAARNAAHDGGAVGAANFWKARNSASLLNHSNSVAGKFGI